MSREALANDIWRACDVMRRDNNCGGVMEYLEHLSWVLFLKFLDGQEEVFEAEAALKGRKYKRIVGGAYRWSEWVPKALGQKRKKGQRAAPEWDGDRLMQFVRGDLIPHPRRPRDPPAPDLLRPGEEVGPCAPGAHEPRAPRRHDPHHPAAEHPRREHPQRLRAVRRGVHQPPPSAAPRTSRSSRTSPSSPTPPSSSLSSTS